MADTTPFYMADEAGILREADPAHASALAASGWTSVSPEQVAAKQLAEQEGGAWGQLKTGAEAAAQALTLGGSTWGETHLLGVDPELIRARERLNPIAHGLGTTIGIAAPLLLSGGAAAPAEAGLAGAETGVAGAEAAASLAPGTLGAVSNLTAPSLIAKAGGAASKWVEGLTAPGAGQLAVDGLTSEAMARAVPGLGRRLLIRGAPGAAGAALEGALYGLGQDIHESALGDPMFSGEALGRIGISALLAGGIGGSLGVSRGLLDAARVGGKGSTASEWLTGKLDEFAGIRGMKAAGAIQKHFNKLIDMGGEDAPAEMGNAFFENKIVGPGLTFRNSLDAAKDVADVAGKSLGEQRTQLDALAKPLVPSAERGDYHLPVSPWGSAADTVPAIQDIVAKARQEIIAPLRSAAKTEMSENAASALDRMLTRYEQTYADGMTYGDLHKMEGEVGKEALGYFKSVNAMQRPAGTALRQFRRQLSDRVEQGVKDLGLDLDKWQSDSWQYQVGKTGIEYAKAGLKREGNNPISPTEFLSILGGTGVGGPLGGAIAGLGTAAVRRFGSGVAGALARAMKGAIEGEVDDIPGVIAGEAPKGVEPAPTAATVEQESPKGTTPTEPVPTQSQAEQAADWNDKMARLQEELRSRRRAASGRDLFGGPNISDTPIGDISGAGRPTPGRMLEGVPTVGGEPGFDRMLEGVPTTTGEPGFGRMLEGVPTVTGHEVPPLDFTPPRGAPRETALDIAAKGTPGITRALKRVQEQQFAQALGLPELDDATRVLLSNAQREGILGRFTGPERLLVKAQEAASGAEQEIKRFGVTWDRKAALDTARGMEGLARRMLDMPGEASRVDARLAGEAVAPRTNTTMAAELDAEADRSFKKGDSSNEHVAELRRKAQVLRTLDTNPNGPVSVTPGVRGPVTASPEQAAALGVLKKTVDAAHEAVETQAAASVKGLAEGDVSGHDLSKMTTKDIQKQIEHIRALAADQARLIRETHSYLHDAANHAPDTATSAAATMTRSVVELAHEAPPLPPPTLGDPAPELGRTEAVEFAKLQKAVEDPTKADISDPAVWRILKAVYPAWASQVAAAVLHNLPEHPSQHQIQFASQVTGLSFSQGSDAQTQALFQQLMQSTPAKAKGGRSGAGSTGLPKARLSKPGVGKMHFASASRTSFQSASEEV